MSEITSAEEQAIIDRASEPLSRLGARLTELLDENQWAECERMLIEAINAQVNTTEGMVSRWQSIETAPTNTPVLVYASHGTYVAVLVDDATDEMWEDGDEHSDLNGYWTVDDNKHGPFALRGCSPSKWMSLPEPPKGGGQ